MRAYYFLHFTTVASEAEKYLVICTKQKGLDRQSGVCFFDINLLAQFQNMLSYREQMSFTLDYLLCFSLIGKALIVIV